MGSLVSLNCQQCKRFTTTILIFSLFFLTFTSRAEKDPVILKKISTVVIDAGHGGHDPGALGLKSKEKDIVLGIALKLGKYIEDNLSDVKVIYTREKDVFVPLFERADIANSNKADLFISIHANASPKKYIFGAETYVMGEDKNDMNFEVAKAENSVIMMEDDYSTKYEGFDPNSNESYIIFSLVQQTHLNQSLSIAGKIQEQFRERVRRVDRGVKQAGFLVLWRTSMPSILIEAGYISHPDEEKFLNSEIGQDYLASAIFRAFRDYKQEIESSSNFNPKVSVNEKNEEKDNASREIEAYYKIQLFSSKTKHKLNDPIFHGYSEIEEFQASNWFKYAVGTFTSYDEARSQLEEIRNKYPDAFIIAVNKGAVIPVNEVKHLIK